jgi:hypothetical protein
LPTALLNTFSTELSPNPHTHGASTCYWIAQEGAQTAFLEAFNIFEVFYAGSRGSGKSYALLLSWIAHADAYGADANGLIVRRELTQLVDLIRESKKVFGPLKWEWREATFRVSTFALSGQLLRSYQSSVYVGVQQTVIALPSMGILAVGTWLYSAWRVRTAFLCSSSSTIALTPSAPFLCCNMIH